MHVITLEPRSVWKGINVALLVYSRFDLLQADSRVPVWPKPQEAIDPNYQQGIVKAVDGSLMV